MMEKRYRDEEITNARRIHVMGIGGSGMGTFAGMLRTRGFEVRGSDAGCYPPMSTLLADWGIADLFSAMHFTVGKPDGLSAVIRGALEDGPVLSIGDIAVSQSNPDIVWVFFN